jgi:hypothetical protein
MWWVSRLVFVQCCEKVVCISTHACTTSNSKVYSPLDELLSSCSSTSSLLSSSSKPSASTFSSCLRRLLLDAPDPSLLPSHPFRHDSPNPLDLPNRLYAYIPARTKSPSSSSPTSVPRSAVRPCCRCFCASRCAPSRNGGPWLPRP